MSTSSIRAAVATDLPQLVGLLAQLSIETPREEVGPPLPGVYHTALDAILTDTNQTLLVAESDGHLLGTVCVIVVPNLSYRARPYAFVENVVVDQKARGQGWGVQLMQCAVAVAQEAGCYKVSLTSHKTRLGSHRFYEAAGIQGQPYRFQARPLTSWS